MAKKLGRPTTRVAPPLPASPVRGFRIKAVTEFVGIHRSTIYRMMQRNEFPKPVCPSPGTRVWLLRDLETFMASRRLAV